MTLEPALCGFLVCCSILTSATIVEMLKGPSLPWTAVAAATVAVFTDRVAALDTAEDTACPREKCSDEKYGRGKCGRLYSRVSFCLLYLDNH